MSADTKLEGFTLARIAGLAGGRLAGADAPVTGFATDSGQILPGDLFLAIKGARHDGHDFVPMALEKGAAGSIAEREVPGPHILVDNLVDALARMAAALRGSFHGPVVGVTGSAGKTTAKELIAAALQPLGPVLKTQGNRNTEYTVPLVWAELTPDHRAAVIEMSMRGFGQIAHLASFSRPTVGVVTNVGYAHVELVGSRRGIAKAKSELLQALPEDGVAVLWQEDEFLEALRQSAGKRRTLTFGMSSKADCPITRYRPLSWSKCEVEGLIGDASWSATLPAVGRHIALDAAAAVLVAHAVGIPAAEAAKAMEAVVLPPLRMQVVESDGKTILLDTYNASPPSMIAAIETLSDLPVSGCRLAVLGDMRELGDLTESAHKQLGKVLAKSKLHGVLFVGEHMRLAYKEAKCHPAPMRMAKDLDDVRQYLRNAKPGDVVLVKGSRALELEKALEDLR